ncbi:MAG: hypothetical protein R6V42_02870 [Orrella sp.]
MARKQKASHCFGAALICIRLSKKSNDHQTFCYANEGALPTKSILNASIDCIYLQVFEIIYRLLLFKANKSSAKTNIKTNLFLA